MWPHSGSLVLCQQIRLSLSQPIILWCWSRVCSSGLIKVHHASRFLWLPSVNQQSSPASPLYTPVKSLLTSRSLGSMSSGKVPLCAVSTNSSICKRAWLMEIQFLSRQNVNGSGRGLLQENLESWERRAHICFALSCSFERLSVLASLVSTASILCPK